MTILDTEREITVDPRRVREQRQEHPFAGWKLTGCAVATVVGEKCG